MKKNVMGYKVFNTDWADENGLRYEVGQTYKMDAKPECSEHGFHFFMELIDCIISSEGNLENKYVEVEALGDVDSKKGEVRYSTNKIRIVREIPLAELFELLELTNTGKNCMGLGNSGDWNEDDCNSGSWNDCSYSNGCFNTETPKIFLFNKLSDWTYEDWIESGVEWVLNRIPMDKLGFVPLSDMTDEEKGHIPKRRQQTVI